MGEHNEEAHSSLKLSQPGPEASSVSLKVPEPILSLNTLHSVRRLGAYQEIQLLRLCWREINQSEKHQDSQVT